MRTATPSPDARTDADPPERALSPLAGVAVMVVLTVALAALIGSLVVAAGVASPGVPPAAAFEFTYTAVDDGYRVTVTHAGGDTVAAADGGSLAVVAASGQRVGFDDRVVAGDSATVGEATPVPPDTVVRVVWTAPGGRTRVLATDRTPA